MLYRSKDLQMLFNRSGETIRLWSQEFKEFLSDTAQTVESGKHRMYSTEDVRVLQLVAESKEAGLSNDEIHVALASGQRGDVEEQVIRQATSMEIAAALDESQQRVAILEADNDQMKSELQDARDKIIRLEAKLEVYEQDKNNQEVRDLHREIGRLEARIEMMREQKKDD